MAHVRRSGHRVGELPVGFRPRDPHLAAAELPDGDAGSARVGAGPHRRPRRRRGGLREAGGRCARRRPRTATTGRGRWLRRDGGALECGGPGDGCVAGRRVANRRLGCSWDPRPFAQRDPGRRGASIRVRARLRVRAGGRQPRRHRRSSPSVDVGNHGRRAPGDPVLDRARAVGRLGHAVRRAARSEGDERRAQADQASGSTGAACRHVAIVRGHGRVRVRELCRDLADPSRDRTAAARARTGHGRAHRRAALCGVQRGGDAGEHPRGTRGRPTWVEVDTW